jgi:cytoskeletal protein CcmA (bactofilin family)
LFNRTKSPASSSNSGRIPADAIPPLPDLPSPGQAKRPAAAAPVAAPAPAPAMGGGASPKGLSTLSSDLVFEGSISGSGDLQIDGSVKGDVRVGRLVVGETGAVEGNVSGDYVEVRGRVVGGVNGKQVKLVGTAYVDGDITHEQLSIDVGAYFQGRCIQGRRDAPAPAAAPQAAPQPAPQPAERPQTIQMGQTA